MTNKRKLRNYVLSMSLTVSLIASNTVSAESILVKPIVSTSSDLQNSETAISRLSGADRYETAIAISKNGWKSSNTAILASGENFSDALCAAPLAKENNAPLLLTPKASLTSEIRAELSRLGVKHVIIIGGAGAISDDIISQLQEDGISSIDRIGGSNRYDTSSLIARQLSRSTEVAIVSGENFPDALSISASAASLGIPLLLSGKDGLSPEVKQYIEDTNPTTTYIVGGTGVLASTIDDQVPSPIRLSGVDRYATSLVVLKEFQPRTKFSTVYIATGDNFADALAGSVLASINSSPIVLVGQTLDTETSEFISSNYLTNTNIIAFGGQSAVSDLLMSDIGALNLVKTATPVKSVSLNKKTDLILLGTTDKVISTITPNNATNQAVSWSSSNERVATVDQAGTITAVGIGTATVTAATKDGNKIATSSITVYNAAVQSTTVPSSSTTSSVQGTSQSTSDSVYNVSGISLNKTTTSLLNGGTDSLSATITPSNADNKTVGWSSSDEKIATVNQLGVITAISAGTANITVTTKDGSKTATCRVTVTAPVAAPVAPVPQVVSVTSVGLSKTTSSLVTGGTDNLSATITPSNADNKTVVWSSSDEKIATVNQLGVITAVSAGNATITVTTKDGSKTATCRVTVTAPVAPVPQVVSVTSVTLSKTTSSLVTGGTDNLSATITPSNATNQAVVWSSSDEKVATVDTLGVITPVGAGTATIKVTTKDGSKTATCNVTVALNYGVIKSRLVENYIANGTFKYAIDYLNAQNTDGSWSTINYADTSLAIWAPIAHLSRIYSMVVAYKTLASGSYNSQEMLEGIKKGLAFWYQRKPTSLNWWQIDIGQQKNLGPIMLMMGDDLPKELVEPGTKLLYDPTQLGSRVTGGQNLVDFAIETIIRGLINNNEKDIKDGFNYLQNEIKITTGEGIQADFSFHQHGNQIYNGGYGMDYINDNCFWMSMATQTNYAFDKSKIDLLTSLLLDGDRWMVRGKNLDASVRGRGITRKNTSNNAMNFSSSCDILLKAGSDRAGELTAFKNTITGKGNLYGVLGNKYFNSSEYMVNQREKYFSSVKMVSARTVGIEVANSENIKGYWLPFGLNYVLQRGDEYNDIYPVWDWGMLPGVTSPHKVVPFKNNVWDTVSQSEKFVGGVSDGTFGVSAMSMNIQNTTAKKSYFFFNDEYVALGAGINSSDENTVNTTLNQCLLNGTVLVDGKEVPNGESKIDKASWVLHDGIAYLPLSDSAVNIKVGPQTGSWKSINDMYNKEDITKDVFTLSIDHGIKPKDASYQYIVLPGVDKTTISDYSANNPIKVISNTSDLQAVKNEKLGSTGIVFYKAGSVDIGNNISIAVDKPCMVLINGEAASAKISVSNPLSDAISIKMTVTSNSKPNDLTFDLPGGALGGSSVTKIYNFK